MYKNDKKKEKGSSYHHNNQVLYSTIDHTKRDYLQDVGNKNEQNNTLKSNLFNDNYVNNNVTNMDNETFINKPDTANECSFLHIEREIPMQSASLEAQKFKTIIFLSGQ